LNFEQRCWEFLEVPEFAERFKSFFDSLIEDIYSKFNKVFIDEQTNNLYFFEHDSIKLKILNVDELNITTKILPLEYFQKNLGGMCLVDKDNLFFYGGVEARDPSSYLFNLKEFEITKLPGKFENSYASCTVYKRKVYIFGGYNKSSLKRSRYLDLDEQRYYEISKLPSSQYSTSVVNIDSNFVISGNDSFLCVYSIPRDTFKVQMRSKCFGKYHVIMNIDRTVYAVLRRCIYVFECFEEKLGKTGRDVVQDVGFSYVTEMSVLTRGYSDSEFGYVTGKPVMRGYFGFFNDNYGCVYRVDLKHFKIIRICDVKETQD